MKHYLTYKDQTSDKFWQIEISGNSFTVTYGKNGSDETTQTKEFKTEEECTKQANKLVAEKLKKGYSSANEKLNKRESVSSAKNKRDGDARAPYFKMLSAKTKKDLHYALCDHFSYMVDTPGFEKVLSALMNEVKEVSVEKNTLHITFNNKSVLTAEPPKPSKKYNDYPKSFTKLLSMHSSLCVDYPTYCCLQASNSFMNDGWYDSCEELEEYDDVKTAINIGSDLYIYHPDEKNALGEPALCFIDHELSALGAFEDMNVGSLFLVKLCEIFEIEVEVPRIELPKKVKPSDAVGEPQQLNEFWWNSLEPIWKIVFALNLPAEKKILRVSNRFDLKRVWNELKIDINSMHEPWQKIANLTELNCVLTSDRSICDFQVKDLTPVAGLTKLQKLEVTSSKVRSLIPLQRLRKLEQLNVSGSEPLKDLAGIEDLQSLVELNLSGTSIKTLEPVYELMNLKTLIINNLEIKTLHGIQKLKSLRTLNASWCSLKDIEGLNLPALEELELGGITLKDVNAFENLKVIKSLTIERCEIVNTAGFKFLSGLRHLLINNLNVNDLAFLNQLTSLEKLEIKYVQAKLPFGTLNLQYCAALKELQISQAIKKIEGIDQLARIEILDIAGTEIGDLNFLQDCTSLKELTCSGKITDLSPLKNCESLEVLDISSTKAKSLASLAGLKKLKSIRCNAEILDLSPLANCSDLESLSVNHRDFDDIDFLGRYKKLTYLAINKNKVKTLEPLKDCIFLEILYCNDTAIDDLSPLRNCTKLRYLNARDTKINSIEPLRKCSELETLIVSNTGVTDLEPISECKKMETIHFKGTEIKSLDALLHFKRLELNPYAVSKYISEEMLREFKRRKDEFIV